MSSQCLTNHLLSISTDPPYKEATQHPFLLQAGQGTLPIGRLALWLSQDRIYAAHAYPRFIGSLISRIPFQNSEPMFGHVERGHEYILETLVKCLENVIREVQFFKDTAAEFGLELEGWKERKGTRDYTAEMARITLTGSMEDGIVFLWAMEKVYFDAWTYVKQSAASTVKSGSGNMESSFLAVQRFADNWSSTEFAALLKSLADLVDIAGVIAGPAVWTNAEDIWRRVIELEAGFWPNAGEELWMRTRNYVQG